MKTLYFDCGMGAAGDMLMASLYEICPDKEKFLKTMNEMGLPGLSVEAEPSVKCGITGTHMKVTIHGEEEESVDVDLQGHEHHHDHDEDEEHEHHHHHDHDDDCCCGHDHDHEHHHHHHADEVFTSWGMETIVPVTKDQLEDILKRLAETKEFGDVLRAKGMLPTENPGEWLYFDLVPEQYEIRDGKPDYTGKVCVIGASLKEEELNKVFGRG